jgi:hypothetical protein
VTAVAFLKRAANISNMKFILTLRGGTAPLTDFAPRLGVAYSPGSGDGFMGKTFGDAAGTSVRSGYGAVALFIG